MLKIPQQLRQVSRGIRMVVLGASTCQSRVTFPSICQHTHTMNTPKGVRGNCSTGENTTDGRI